MSQPQMKPFAKDGEEEMRRDAGALPTGNEGQRGPQQQPVLEGAQDDTVTPPMVLEGDVVARQGTDEERLQEVLSGVVGRLDRLAQEQVSQRQMIEMRWLEDTQQYYGKYSAKVLAGIRRSGGSELFANQTRPKVTSWAARLGDMLFPTDENNWSVEPTPVPDLALGANDAVQRARKAAAAATQAAQKGDQQGEQQALAQGHSAAQDAKNAQDVLDEAKARSEAMGKLIDDQLEECNYNRVARSVILDACKIGTGIMKGPVVGPRVKRAWTRAEDGTYVLQNREDARPSYVRTDPWHFFPDMAATRIEDAEFTFERHMATKKELKRWRNMPGFNVKAIDDLLKQEPREPMPDYFGQLRNITEIGQPTADKNYLVWEYHGPLEQHELAAMAEATGDHEMLDIIELLGVPDLQCVIWFCQGKTIRYGLHPLESGESLYSPFCFDRDETSIFGYGVPYLMRDPQAAFNAAWRMMIDNGSLSAGPQIVINTKNIEPEDGSNDLYAKKIWIRKQDAPTSSQPDFQVVQIDCRQADLTQIAELAKEFTDDETNMPPIAYGESGSHVTKTAQGMGMLMNSANVIFRHIVKNFDEQLTVPNIQRIYDWNMQFAANDLVKGDFDVKARGSSVLLVRELQAQSLDAIAEKYGTSPIFGPMLKVTNLFRKLMQAHMIDADEIVKSKDEYDAAMQAIAKAQSQQQDPNTLRAQTAMEIAKDNNQTRLQLQMMMRETAMMLAAANGNITLEELKAKLQIVDKTIGHQEREFAAEAALTPAGTHGGGGNL